MKIALVAPTAIRIPVTGYGGIEAEVEWLAGSLAELGHDVTIFGKLDRKVLDDVPWKGVRLRSEESALRHLEELRTYDAVHDWSHNKPLRLAKLTKYVSTTMWTDQRSGRDVYPSHAVAEAFGDPESKVLYLGIPTRNLPDPRDPDEGAPFVSFGRITPYKGQDLAIEVARAAHVPLAVAGHMGRFVHRYYALTIKKKCRDAGFKFLGELEPEEVDRFLESARGLLHLHRWIESFSLVAAHALCLGVPVLTTDVGAPKELIAATEGGVTIKVPEDASKWPSSPPDVEAFFLKKWDRRAIAERAQPLFDIGYIAQLYTALYEGL